MIIFNNGPGTRVGIQAETVVIKGGVPVAPEGVETGEITADDENGGE